jgi:hypothetical protein
MSAKTTLTNLEEIKTYFGFLHRQYSIALEGKDILGRIETSGNLAAAYRVVGNIVLSQKWSEEVKNSLLKLHRRS